MLTNQPLKTEILYNLITTIIFLSIVVALPLFLLILTTIPVFLIYGAIPLFLGLWTFLREPENQIKRKKMEVLSIKYPDVTKQIISLPAYTELKTHPEILYIPSESLEVFAFGTWKKRYIAISEGAITNWKDPVTRAGLLTHEISHIANGDTWKTGFSTHYLYWLFGISILVAIRSFPYSLFFNIYNSFRADNGIADLITTLTIFVLDFAVLLATRFLYRIKEYSADAFAKRYMGLSDYIKAFVLLATNKPNIYNKKTKLPYQALLFKTLGFHPSTQARLSVLQSPFLLINELPSLVFVAGIFLGYISCYILDLDSSFAVIINSEIVTGFLLTSLILITQQKFGIETIERIKFSIKIALNLANGTAISFIILVGTNNLLLSESAEKSFFRHGAELAGALFVTLDVLLLIMIIVPVLITSLGLLLNLLLRLNIIKKQVWIQMLFTIIAFFPSIGLLNFYVGQWWKGVAISIDKLQFLLLVCALWVLATILLWQIISYWRSKTIKSVRL